MTARNKARIKDRLRDVKPVPALLVLLLLASAALTAWLYFSWYRPGAHTGSRAAATAVDAAREGTVAMLSYAPDTIDDDLAAAKSHLTGDFLSYYDDFARQVVAPASRQKRLKTTAEVVGVAVAELHPDSAVVLVFVNQTTTSKEQPDPSIAARSVSVSLSKVNDSWLIEKFDPA